MIQRIHPQEYFLQTNNNNTMLYLGLIALGIVCVTIVAIVYLRR